ncbi:efflux RND transporter permease subunit [Paraflavisolibacter sp. H34]|uniref:efflux RND transporter permease subunit n=1 Tax=Huijunlia imazamoxiresistens TaxID=3127457 RepID=UPI0030161440
MQITNFFVRNYQFTLVVFLMIIVVSVSTLLNMPRAEDPDIHPPQFPIVVIYPGTSPKDMEELVVKPIEKKVSELQDLKKIATEIHDGVAVITVDFRYECDVDTKHQELMREINSLRPDLPPDIYKLEVRKVTPTDVNVLQMALVSGSASNEALRHQAEGLKTELEKVKSLKKVAWWGLPDQVIRVQLKLDKIARAGIPLPYVIQSIQSEAAELPGGSVQAGTRMYNIKTTGKYRSLDQVRNTIVYSAQGKVVYLKDVADVAFGYDEEKHITRINGHRCVLVTAAQKEGENIAKTREAYRPVVASFEKGLPAGISLVKNFDQALNVEKRLRGLGIDFLVAIALVLITLLPLGRRASLIVMVAIPLSLGLGIVALSFLGYSLNQLSIVGLVVALGLSVDDSIVVVENIVRWMREGRPRGLAAVEATKQITTAVLGCTAALTIAFLPLVFLPDVSGEFIRGLPLAVITSVFASMIVCLTIVPFMASRFLKAEDHPEDNVFHRVLKRAISGTYSKVLDVALKHPRRTLVLTVVLFVASLALFGQIGFRLFPSSEKPQFLVNIHMPLQSTLEATNRMAREVEQELGRHDQVRFFTTNVGKGNPRIYYNEFPENQKNEYAQLYVQLQPSVGMKEKKALIDSLRETFRGYAGTRIEVKDFEQGPVVEAPVVIRLAGDHFDSLRILARQVEHMLLTIPGTLYVKNESDLQKSDLKLNIHTEKARTLAVQPADIKKTVRLSVAGVPVGKYAPEQGDDLNIIMSAPKEQFATVGTLDRVFVNNGLGQPVPLKQVADLEFESSPSIIKHLDKKRFVVVTAFTQKGVFAADINKAFEKRVGELHFPTGYEYQIAGEAEGEQNAFGSGFITVVLATVFLFVMVLILEFKTFKSTLIVLSVIPLGVIGGVAALALAGYPLSFVAIIGFIGLAGVEVKNSILLVDFTNQLRAEGKSLEEAIREAGELRFLPIVLTSLTAIGGFIPIAVSSSPLVSPLALVIIGGLISSTLLSRIVTPVVYKLLPPRVERLSEEA